MSRPFNLARGGHLADVRNSREERIMATEDKAADKAKEVKGTVKENVGKAAGNPELEAEGKADRVEGNLKQAGEKVKDAFRK